MTVYDQTINGVNAAAESIAALHDSVFAGVLDNPEIMTAIRTYIETTKKNGNLWIGDKRTKLFPYENDRDLFCKAIAYFKARWDLTHNKNVRQAASFFGQTDNISWIDTVCAAAGVSFQKPEQKVKTEQEKDAEQKAGRDAVADHLSGKKKPVKDNPKTATPTPVRKNVPNRTIDVPNRTIEEITQKETKDLVPLSALDCMEITPKRYILDGLIEDETITLFSGKEKIGKTYVLMNMALCMAASKPWLGIETMGDVQGSILWLNLDMSRSTATRRIYEVTNGIEESWNVRDQHLFDSFYLMDGQTFRDANRDNLHFFTDNNAIDGLQEYIIANNVKVCFIDNLIQIEGEAQENSSNDIQKVFNRVKQLRDITHCSFVLIHHTTKDGGRFRGSGDISAETDLNLQLEQCTNPKQLILKTDGARNSAAQDIGMMKTFMQRIGDDGTPMTDANGHPVNIFKLDRIDTDGLETESGVRKTKSSATTEGNIEQIKKLFSQNGNAALSKTAIVSECYKSGLKLSGQRQAQLDSVDIAYGRGILRQNTAGQYLLNDLS